MITKRIIPCLDVKNGRVVKGVNFEGLQDMADPVEMARYYNASGADELVFYDITASVEGRGLFTDILRRVASQIFIPLTVGGGINTLDDFDRVLKCGADKVSVNSGAIRNPGIIPAAAQKYGNQCVVLSADIKRVDGKFMLFAKGGRENTGIDALDWLEQGVKNGAGELVVNSIDTDGVKNGFDLELLDAVAATGATVLYDRWVQTTLGGAAVRIGGSCGHFRDINRSAKLDYAMEETIGAADVPGIVLLHMPESLLLDDARERWTGQVFLSGHTHGGVIRILLIGGLVAPTQGLFPKYDQGKFTVDGRMTLIITSGLAGYACVPRVCNRPEVCVVDLIPEEGS